MSGVTPFAFLIIMATIGLAALAASLRWREPIKNTQPKPPTRPIDRETHTLTYLGADGRPNPLQYETFADYPSALTRQRAQARLGKPSIVRHNDSGEVRIDFSEIFGGFRPMGF
jgi:hypothetical protein